ncbi:MAG TPA: hypothetical protein VER37_04760 [Thermomicrobiales bacterium]|nr:hypothetical protein [Thermomicrobiales bacterium]
MSEHGPPDVTLGSPPPFAFSPARPANAAWVALLFAAAGILLLCVVLSLAAAIG